MRRSALPPLGSAAVPSPPRHAELEPRLRRLERGGAVLEPRAAGLGGLHFSAPPVRSPAQSPKGPKSLTPKQSEYGQALRFPEARQIEPGRPHRYSCGSFQRDLPCMAAFRSGHGSALLHFPQPDVFEKNFLPGIMHLTLLLPRQRVGPSPRRCSLDRSLLSFQLSLIGCNPPRIFGVVYEATRLGLLRRRRRLRRLRLQLRGPRASLRLRRSS